MRKVLISFGIAILLLTQQLVADTNQVADSDDFVITRPRGMDDVRLKEFWNTERSMLAAVAEQPVVINEATGRVSPTADARANELLAEHIAATNAALARKAWMLHFEVRLLRIPVQAIKESMSEGRGFGVMSEALSLASAEALRAPALLSGAFDAHADRVSGGEWLEPTKNRGAARLAVQLLPSEVIDGRFQMEIVAQLSVSGKNLSISQLSMFDLGEDIVGWFAGGQNSKGYRYAVVLIPSMPVTAKTLQTARR